MPFGLTWPQYLFHWVVGFGGLLAGSQLVHMTYKPLEGFEDVVKEEIEKIRRERNIRPLSKEEKLEIALEMDREYIKFVTPKN